MRSPKLLQNNSTATGALTSTFFATRKVRAWWCEDRRSDPGHVKAGLLRIGLPDGQVDVHLSHTTARRRGIAKLGQFRQIAEVNDVDIIRGDFNTSAHRERGKSKLSSIEDVWSTTLLPFPPELVPTGWLPCTEACKKTKSCK